MPQDGVPVRIRHGFTHSKCHTSGSTVPRPFSCLSTVTSCLGGQALNIQVLTQSMYHSLAAKPLPTLPNAPSHTGVSHFDYSTCIAALEAAPAWHRMQERPPTDVTCRTSLRL
jgi:hypothetical protein